MYQFTAFYIYKAVFMVELLVAYSLMSMGSKRKPHFVLRFIFAWILCIAFAFAIPVVVYNAIYCSLVFIVMFGFSLLAMKFCFDENWMSILFRGFAAYTMQHIAYEFYDLSMLGVGYFLGQGISTGAMYGSGEATEYFFNFMYVLRFPDSSASPVMFKELQILFTYTCYFFLYLLTYSVGYSFAVPRLRDSDKFQLKFSNLFIFIVFFVIFNILLSSFVTYYSVNNFNALYVVLLGFFNIACSFFLMYLMFELIFKKQLKRDYVIANRLLKQAEEQYKLSKQNIELINLKCHDLKHQIRLLNASTGVSKEAIKEIEDMIAIYDAKISTGNEALDIILTEKSLYCNKQGIKLYCIVDGQLLSFMSEVDLYSLFGNILDNAIEAVENLEEGRRFINISVKRINGFVAISASNPLAKELVFDDGLPKSTKANKELHGFGMKSIRFICRKYNGEMSISAKRGTFTLNIVFMNS